MKRPNFKPSTTVTHLETGKTRDSSFDDAVRAAASAMGKVFEELVSPEDAEEYRKGLARSAKFLNDTGEVSISLTQEYEETSREVPEVDPETGKRTGNKVPERAVWVRFAAVPKITRKRNASNGSATAETSKPTADETSGELVDA
jgi:hypothetical protein